MGLIPPQKETYYRPAIAMTWNPRNIVFDWSKNSLEQQQASKQGWGVIGWQPLPDEGSPVIWEPTTPRYKGTSISVGTPKDESWARILEQAMTGDELALRAFTDIVSTNPSFAEFQDTLDALTKHG